MKDFKTILLWVLVALLCIGQLVTNEALKQLNANIELLVEADGLILENINVINETDILQTSSIESLLAISNSGGEIDESFQSMLDLAFTMIFELKDWQICLTKGICN